MSREHFRVLFARAFTVTGWFYALMLTAKEAVGYMDHIPWYEMLAANVIILMICTPLVYWIYYRYWPNADPDQALKR